MGGTPLCQAAETATHTDLSTTPVAKSAARFDVCKAMADSLKLFDAKRDNADNPWIQSVSLKARMQYQWAAIDPAGGADRVKGGADGHGRRENDEWRRFRLGAEAKVLRHFTLYGNFNIGGLDTRYKMDGNGNWHHGESEETADEVYLKGDFAPVSFTIGKHKPAFIGEYRTSSAKIITLERSALVNQLTPEKLYGVSVRNSDKKAGLGWEAGLWMNGLDEDTVWLLPVWDSKESAMLGIGLSYATGKHSRLYLDYMHSFAHTDVADATKGANTYGGPGAKDVVALTWEAKKDKLSFMAEAMAGFDVINGADCSQNVAGVTLMPSYRLTPHWEGVLRYQLSAGSNAVKEDSRYYATNSAYSGTCDLMHGFYMGVNYYVCPTEPHMMKWMAGVEYLNSHGTDAKGEKAFTGWSFSTGLRCNF